MPELKFKLIELTFGQHKAERKIMVCKTFSFD